MIVAGRNGRRRSIFTKDDAHDRVMHIRSNLTDDEQALVDAIGVDLLSGEEKVMGELNSIYRWQPVSMEQFIEDPYYLGESCSTIFPQIKADLIQMFSRNYNTILITGSIGIGKTYISSIAICRVLYELSCLKSPQRTYGLSSGTEMTIPLISKNLTLAREVLKGAIDDKIKESPYFMTYFPPRVKADNTLFPNGVRVVVASYTSDRVIGSNAFCAVLDEVNFPPKRKAQQIAVGMGQKKKIAHFDLVEKIYGQLVRRIKSRFQVAGGGFPGMVILTSSAATVESFTERRIRESVDDPDIFVRDHTQWTVKGKKSFSGECFYVLCSTSSFQSRILSSEEVDEISDEYLEANDAFIMDIPIEFREDFELNMEEALRDIAGFSTQAISLYIQRQNCIPECINKDRFHPFSVDEWISGSRANPDWKQLSVEIERRLPGGYTETAYKPRINPDAYRWCHIDIAISGDSCGMTIGHIDRWVEVVRRDAEGNKHVDTAPSYIIDFMLRINPPLGEQIYLPDVRALLYQFMDHGYKFIGLSTDAYMYIEMHQQIKRKGITPHLLSVDTSVDPYDELKSAFYERRIEIYEYHPFIEEFKKLEYDRLAGKIDHPPAGCFVGDTRIRTIDGNIKISELAGKEVFVYAYGYDGIVVRKARGRLTKHVKSIMEVKLSNGLVERCTEEHPWMILDGTYREANKLGISFDVLKTFDGAHPIQVKEVIPVELDIEVPVYDLEVEEFCNFALASGVFVHNSKDVSDSVAGCVFSLKNAAARMPMEVRMQRDNPLQNENAWVSPLIPANQVDAETIRELSRSDSMGFLPIIFGD